MSKVATIERITKLAEHSNADTLQIASVLGWTVCVKKGEFNEQDLVVYVSVDSVMAERPEFEFLRNKHFRIKTMKLRGQVSQGICFPLKLWPDLHMLPEGTEVGHLIHVSHYEKPVPAQLAGSMKGFFPGFIKKTDEDNLKSYPKALEELYGKECYVTQKIDGSSATYYTKDGVFGICSRNVEFKLGEDANAFINAGKELELEEKMLALGRNIALQGELYGPNIQGNKLGISKISLAFFSAFDIDKHKYLDKKELVDICAFLDLTMVPIVWEGKMEFTLPELVTIANSQVYPNGSEAEGIVLRPVVSEESVILKTNLSVKIINENFLLKYKE